MTLQEIRHKRGLSQSQLSRKSGVDLQMISLYERGLRSLQAARADTVRKYAEALDVSMETLLDAKQVVQNKEE